eukprot:1148607-Pelagomonas_calceolata.AAC.5
MDPCTTQVAKAAAAAWTKELREGLGDVLSVGAEDPCAPKTEPAGMFGTLPLTLCLRHLPAATSWLTEQHCLRVADQAGGTAVQETVKAKGGKIYSGSVAMPVNSRIWKNAS